MKKKTPQEEAAEARFRKMTPEELQNTLDKARESNNQDDQQIIREEIARRGMQPQ